MWCSIFNKTTIHVEILYDGLSKIEPSLKEQELIKQYGRKDLNNGVLCNMTDGGDGIWNCKKSDETKEKIGLSKRGVNNPQYGKKQSPETILKRSISSTGLKRCDDTKRKQSVSSIKSGQAKQTNLYVYETGELIGTFHSISEACRHIGLSPLTNSSKACMVANGKRKQMKGYIFKYI